MNNTPNSSPLLMLMPSVKVYRQNDGKQFITQKFIAGVEQYRELWPGDIQVFVEQSDQPDGNLDKVDISNIKNFTLTVVDFDHIEEKLAQITTPAIALAAIHYRQNDIAATCRRYNIDCVQTSEYTLNTRFQIVKANKKNLLKRWRGYLWEYLQEKKNVQSIRLSSAVQCNGLPTYNIYKRLNDNSLLYFDSRVYAQDVIDHDQLKKRLSYCLEGKPLRLLFSGRLNAMKGADHLVLFARELKQLNVDFHLTICGDGDLAESLRQAISQWQLNDYVTMAGVLEFHSELLPFVKENADIFICCHRQGDPSCTYIETMSCGVPIASYDNEAFVGMQKESGSGWTITMDDYRQLAKLVQALSQNRQEISNHSIRARDFSVDHTFEKTFAKRINHIENTVAKHDT